MNRFYDYACCFHEKTKEIIWLAFDSNLLQTPVVKPSDFLTVPEALVLSTVHSYFLYTPFYYIRNLVCIVFSLWNVELSLTALTEQSTGSQRQNYMLYSWATMWSGGEWRRSPSTMFFHLKLQNVEQRSFPSSMARVLAWPRPGTPRSITWLLCCRSTDQLEHPGEARQAVVCLQSPWSGGWCPSPPPPPPSPPPNSLSCFQSSLFSTRLAPYCSMASPTPPTQPCPRAVPAAPGRTLSTSGTPCGRGTSVWRTSR